MSGVHRLTTVTATEAGLPQALPSLTSLRGFAALGVFVYHLQAAGLIDFPPAQLGYAGVAFFFVLSGFVLAWGYGSKLSIWQFYVRRIARVYPSHIVIWLVVLLFSTPAVVRLPDPLTVILNFFLLQAWPPNPGFAFSLNGVAWSLSCEIGFYALFPWAAKVLYSLGSRTRWIVSFSLLACSSAFVLATTGASPASPTGVIQYVNPIVRIPEFLLGVVAAMAIRSGWRPGWLHAVVAFVVTGLGFALNHEHPSANVWGAILFTAFIVAAALSDISRPFRLLHSRALIYVGKISFCFYLVHQLVIIHLVTLGLDQSLTIIVSFGASLALAIGLHHAVELPAHKWLVRWHFLLNTRTSKGRHSPA